MPGSAGRCGSTLGLDLPERRIGLSAHDFAQMLGAPEVILTRAAKIGGAPTQASRFVQRLAAIAGDNAGRRRSTAAMLSRLGAQSRSPDAVHSRAAPGADAAARGAPAAPVGHRDRALAARSLHHLRQACAQLAPLDEVDAAPGAAERGTVIHNVLREFTERFAASFPPIRPAS